MRIKCTRHPEWTLNELAEVAKENGKLSREIITVDTVIRVSIFRFIEANRKHPIRISKASVRDEEFRVRKSISKE